jgi:hypothetical protein
LAGIVAIKVQFMSTAHPPTTPDRPALSPSVRATVEVALAALGALVTHQLAYLAVSVLAIGVPSLSDHRHLSAQWAIVAPIAIGISGVWIAKQLRSLGLSSSLAGSISVHRLGGLVAVLFLLQENLEGAFTGHGPAQVLAHPATTIGVVIAPLVALALRRLLLGTAELVARFISTESLFIPATPRRPDLVPVPVRSHRGSSRSRPRAPPGRHRF